jgi:hypothetical protein
MIPEGYKDYLPAALKKQHLNILLMDLTRNKGKAFCIKLIIVNKPVLLKSEFEAWNKFIKEINTFYNDQVVLVKNK